MTLVDDLFDCLVFELDGVFRWLHLLFSISVLTSYLSTGLGEYHVGTIESNTDGDTGGDSGGVG